MDFRVCPEGVKPMDGLNKPISCAIPAQIHEISGLGPLVFFMFFMHFMVDIALLDRYTGNSLNRLKNPNRKD